MNKAESLAIEKRFQNILEGLEVAKEMKRVMANSEKSKIANGPSHLEGTPGVFVGSHNSSCHIVISMLTAERSSEK